MKPAPKKPTATAATEVTRTKRRRKTDRDKRRATEGKDFLRNEPSPGAVTRDAIGIISRGVTPRATGKVITKLPSERWQQGGGRPVAVRASLGWGEERVERQDIATLRLMRWINDSIINFMGKVLVQLWRGRGATNVHVFSSHMMDILLSGTDWFILK